MRGQYAGELCSARARAVCNMHCVISASITVFTMLSKVMGLTWMRSDTRRAFYWQLIKKLIKAKTLLIEPII